MRCITQLAAVSLPGRKDGPHRSRRGSAGISLLEVLMAISLLGISFATIFSGLSAALRATDHLGAFDRANAFATQKLSAQSGPHAPGRRGAHRNVAGRHDLVAGDNPVDGRETGIGPQEAGPVGPARLGCCLANPRRPAGPEPGNSEALRSGTGPQSRAVRQGIGRSGDRENERNREIGRSGEQAESGDREIGGSDDRGIGRSEDRANWSLHVLGQKAVHRPVSHSTDLPNSTCSLFTRSPDHPITRSFGLPITRLPGLHAFRGDNQHHPDGVRDA